MIDVFQFIKAQRLQRPNMVTELVIKINLHVYMPTLYGCIHVAIQYYVTLSSTHEIHYIPIKLITILEYRISSSFVIKYWLIFLTHLRIMPTSKTLNYNTLHFSLLQSVLLVEFASIIFLMLT